MSKSSNTLELKKYCTDAASVVDKINYQFDRPLLRRNQFNTILSFKKNSPTEFVNGIFGLTTQQKSYACYKIFDIEKEIEDNLTKVENKEFCQRLRRENVFYDPLNNQPNAMSYLTLFNELDIQEVLTILRYTQNDDGTLNISNLSEVKFDDGKQISYNYENNGQIIRCTE